MGGGRIIFTAGIYLLSRSTNSSVNSPYGYTNKAAFNVVVGEENQGEWLNGWGNATSSTYSAGEYGFELYYKGRQIYKGTFHIY